MKKKTVFFSFFYRVHTSPNSRFHSYLKSMGSSRSVSAPLFPFSFPNRSTTSNFSSLHNSSFTDHFSTTSHQPFPPCKFTFRFFFFFFFSLRSRSFKSLQATPLLRVPQRQILGSFFSALEYFHEGLRSIRNNLPLRRLNLAPVIGFSSKSIDAQE